MATVELDKVSKRYLDSAIAVDDVSLSVNDREFLVLVGPSGCGKSTTLRLIAGLELCDDGEVQIGSKKVNDVAAKDRNIAMVFQNYALYPHMSVYKNLSFGLELRYGGGYCARFLRQVFYPKKAADLRPLRNGIPDRVHEAARRLGIEHLLKRKPHQLSGGERQRVALGRAIVREPAAFLFDEPLSNLDAKLRLEMRAELKRLHSQLGATMIYVTHDQVEAMTLGDRIAVMNQGKIQQVGPPLEVYQEPANLFVAQFIGSGPINVIEGKLERKKNHVRFENEDFNTEKSITEESTLFQQLTTGSRTVLMGVRPENVTIKKNDQTEDGNNFNTASITAIDQLGDSVVVHLETSNNSKQNTSKQQKIQATLIQARIESDSNYRIGETVRVEFNHSRLLWFDPQTGDNLLKEIKHECH